MLNGSLSLLNTIMCMKINFCLIVNSFWAHVIILKWLWNKLLNFCLFLKDGKLISRQFNPSIFSKFLKTLGIIQPNTWFHQPIPFFLLLCSISWLSYSCCVFYDCKGGRNCDESFLKEKWEKLFLREFFFWKRERFFSKKKNGRQKVHVHFDLKGCHHFSCLK